MYPGVTVSRFRGQLGRARHLCIALHLDLFVLAQMRESKRYESHFLSYVDDTTVYAIVYRIHSIQDNWDQKSKKLAA